MVKRTTLHHTDPESARDILERGVDLEKSDPAAGWGHGFYSTTKSDRRHGRSAVRVAVRLRRPFIVRDPIAGALQVDELLRQTGHFDDIRAALLALGYDGAVIHYSDDDIWVVAFAGEQVKVVVREGGRAPAAADLGAFASEG